MIFFELLIEKYIGCFSSLIFKNEKTKKKDIESFLIYIIKIFNDAKLNNFINTQFISNNKIFSKFLLNVFNNINYHENIDIYNKYKDDLINCFVNIYKNNTNESNFFDILINQNKKSFINLVNYETRKDNIIKDIYAQNFYIELLHKLFSNKNNNQFSEIKNEEKYFKFNGYNSKITLKLNDFSLNNSILFFSFQLSDEVNIANNQPNNLPLILFQSDTGNDILFKLYLKKENNSNKLFIYQQKGEKKKIFKSLDKLGNIQSNILYFIAIKFTNKKIRIFLNKLDKIYEKLDE